MNPSRSRVGLGAACMVAVLSSAPAVAQSTPRVYAIEGARIVTLAGPVLDAGTVIVRDGRIAAVGANVAVPAGAERIDGKGLHVYPGLFDAVTQIGMTEIGQVSATVDTTELGDVNPQLVAAVAVHPASEHIPVARANGVTHTVAVPGLGGGGSGAGTLVGGQASAIHLNGWTIEEMLVERSVGIVLNWPRLTPVGGFGAAAAAQRQRPFSELKQEYDKRVADVGDWIERARRYQLSVDKAPQTTERDLKLEALVPIVAGQRPLLVVAAEKRQIRDAVEFAVARKLRIVLLGARDAREVKDLLAKHAVPVVLGPAQALPPSEDAPYDAAYALAGDLHKAGIAVSIATFNSSDSRTLPYEAGTAVAFGLPWEDGLKAITIQPARALGLADRLGTIEPGKIANLIVTTGDPLEITTQVKHLFIQGQPVSLDNRHLRSYERWRSRPRPTATK